MNCTRFRWLPELPLHAQGESGFSRLVGGLHTRATRRGDVSPITVPVSVRALVPEMGHSSVEHRVRRHHVQEVLILLEWPSLMGRLVYVHI